MGDELRLTYRGGVLSFSGCWTGQLCTAWRGCAPLYDDTNRPVLPLNDRTPPLDEKPEVTAK